MRGVNANGAGTWSDPTVFVADREDASYPRMPKGFTAYPRAGHDVQLNWDTPDGVTGYRIVAASCGDDMMDHRGFPNLEPTCVIAVRTERNNSETEYLHRRHSGGTFRYAVQWIKAGATASEDVYSALSFIYRVTTKP